MRLVKKQDIKDKNVAKAQPLVEAAYNFSIWEKRVYTILASLVDKNDPDFKFYRINIKDIIDFYECKSHDAYERIREVPESLLSKNKIIKIPYTTEDGHKRVLKTHLITAVTEPDGADTSDANGYIELEFHPKLKPFLLGLKRYLCYDIKNTIGISSVHTLRIFEFLKLHQYKREHRITVLELKIMLGLEEKHKKYGHFKRIIIKAQKDLEKHTDIKFVFEEIKQGRSVHALNFRIIENKVNQSKDHKELPNTEESSKWDSDDNLKVYSKIKNWGITRSTFLLFLQKYDHGYIEERINYINSKEETTEIRNKAGYLRKILDQPILFDEVQYKKEKKVSNKKKKQEQTRTIELVKKRLLELKKDLNQEENRVIDRFFAEENAIMLEIIAKTQTSGFAKSLYNNDLEPKENFEQNERFRNFVYAEAKKIYPKLLIETRELYLPQIEMLKKKV